MRGEARSGATDELKSTEGMNEAVSVEKQQELLLINKLAAGGKLPPKSQGSFLQKKLQHRKFFDSGDYVLNQQKEKKKGGVLPPAAMQQNLADQQQSAEVKLSVQTHQIEEHLQSPPLANVTSFGCSSDTGDIDDEEHLEIPRPDTVPKRKASILHPSVHSKLSPHFSPAHEINDESITAPPE